MVTTNLSEQKDFELLTAWLSDYLGVIDCGTTGTKLPFSFVYNGKKSDSLLQNILVDVKVTDCENKKRITFSFPIPDSTILLTCVLVKYTDYPIVEWTLYFKNTGTTDSALISDIMPINAGFGVRETDPVPEFVLHHHTGSPCSQDDYRPHRTLLTNRQSKRITTCGGRSVNSDSPYFNIEYANRGVIFALGWAGQWATNFFATNPRNLNITGGQELTNFKLLPGEEVRTPMVVLQFWNDDRIRAHNVWRRWMLEHNMPKDHGNPLKSMTEGYSGRQFEEMDKADTASQIYFIDRYLEEGIDIDYWWMDAGWYPIKKDWHDTGTWEVDKTRFPNGLREITDYAHSKKLKSIVWFEPERVAPDTWLSNIHPEWLLSSTDGKWKLLNLGNTDAREWWINQADKVINEQGIDLYRTDFNMEPLKYWRENDAPDRQGITEIKYVEGLYSYLDELQHRHPGMLIDICASGGRRNDVETLRRGVPLWRTDYITKPQAHQQCTYSISFWIPYHGTGGFAKDSDYLMRSIISCPSMNYIYDMRDKTLNYNDIRKWHALHKRIAKYYLGDYYPLTQYTNDNDSWLAWQFDRPDLGEGVVQSFIRENTPVNAMKFSLRGLTPNLKYEIVNIDTNETLNMTGEELTHYGITLAPTVKPSAMIFIYKIVKS
ncbi:MAG: alpha-galactosidase [Elusimicrobiota bacterium]